MSGSDNVGNIFIPKVSDHKTKFYFTIIIFESFEEYARDINFLEI